MWSSVLVAIHSPLESAIKKDLGVSDWRLLWWKSRNRGLEGLCSIDVHRYAPVRDIQHRPASYNSKSHKSKCSSTSYTNPLYNHTYFSFSTTASQTASILFMLHPQTQLQIQSHSAYFPNPHSYCPTRFSSSTKPLIHTPDKGNQHDS